mmetsp:Transcript_14689/g.35853  ORF Transcript_14689/g.35853 Transcript_14689/m.35853 type:complete len:154 (+) Transcript_14689:364-825(+)
METNMDLRKVLRHMTWLQDAEGENRPTQVPVLKKKHIYELYTACSSDAAGAEKIAGLKDLLHACVKEIYPLPEWIGKDFIYQVASRCLTNEGKAEWFDLKATLIFCRKYEMDRPPWYQACPKEGCNKKVNQMHDDQYQCEKCNATYPECTLSG